VENTGLDPIQVTFLARNDGRSGGVIRVRSFSFNVPDVGSSTTGIEHEGIYVAPGKEERFIVPVLKSTYSRIYEFLQKSPQVTRWLQQLHPGRNDPNGSAVLNKFLAGEGISCEFAFSQTSFHSSQHTAALSIPCGSLDWYRISASQLLADSLSKK
jgi:hypothetical protein